MTNVLASQHKPQAKLLHFFTTRTHYKFSWCIVNITENKRMPIYSAWVKTQSSICRLLSHVFKDVIFKGMRIPKHLVFHIYINKEKID